MPIVAKIVKNNWRIEQNTKLSMPMPHKWNSNWILFNIQSVQCSFFSIALISIVHKHGHHTDTDEKTRNHQNTCFHVQPIHQQIIGYNLPIACVGGVKIFLRLRLMIRIIFHFEQNLNFKWITTISRLENVGKLSLFCDEFIFLFAISQDQILTSNRFEKEHLSRFYRL